MANTDSLGQFEQLVLSAVEMLRDKAYGRAIHAKVSELSGDKEVNLGAVYVTLERLSEKGYLKSWMADPTPERGGRSKRYYRLEAEGARALQKSLSTSQRIHEALGDSWRIGRWRPRRAK